MIERQGASHEADMPDILRQSLLILHPPSNLMGKQRDGIVFWRTPRLEQRHDSIWHCQFVYMVSQVSIVYGFCKFYGLHGFYGMYIWAAHQSLQLESDGMGTVGMAAF